MYIIDYKELNANSKNLLKESKKSDNLIDEILFCLDKIEKNMKILNEKTEDLEISFSINKNIKKIYKYQTKARSLIKNRDKSLVTMTNSGEKLTYIYYPLFVR